jgi:DNA gyrase/topoisomerase IV subunit A
MSCVDTEIGKIVNEIEIQKGFLIVAEDIDTTIQKIRASPSPELAALALIKHFSLSKWQAKRVLCLTLRQTTGLEMKAKDKIIFLEIQKSFLEKLKTHETI